MYIQIEEITDVQQLYEFVRERTPSEQDVARFAAVVQETLMQYMGRSMVIHSTSGEMEIPDYARKPGGPAKFKTYELIFHINEFANPGFRFAVDEHEQIQYIVTRDPDAPLDAAGPPTGTTIH
jgi:hypothetical protein